MEKDEENEKLDEEVKCQRLLFFFIEMRRRFKEGHHEDRVKSGEQWAGEGDKNNLFCLNEKGTKVTGYNKRQPVGQKVTGTH